VASRLWPLPDSGIIAGFCDIDHIVAVRHAVRFGLTAQLRRAAVSVPSNVAEGQGRLSTGEFKQFLGHARGSLLEVETQIMIAANLGYFTGRQSGNLLKQTIEVGRILNGQLAH
jgi:four helix bundle protein